MEIKILVHLPGKREPVEQTVDARATDCPHLAVHKTINPDGLSPRNRGKKWTVTHAPTGLVAFYADLLREAKAYAQAASAAGDWDFTDAKQAPQLRSAHEAGLNAAREAR